MGSQNGGLIRASKLPLFPTNDRAGDRLNLPARGHLLLLLEIRSLNGAARVHIYRLSFEFGV